MVARGFRRIKKWATEEISRRKREKIAISLRGIKDWALEEVLRGERLAWEKNKRFKKKFNAF